MSWWQALPAILTAAMIVVLPGVIFARSVGTKGFASFALSPLLSCGIVGAAGIIGGVLRVPWSIWVLLVASLSFSILAFAIRLLIKRNRPTEPEISEPRRRVVQALVITGGLISGAFITCRHLFRSIGSPENFAQVYDNVFHLNAIRYIVETGDASTLTLGRMVSPNSAISVYPSVWHSICALVTQLSGSSVMVSENALTVVASALIWPLACIALVRGLVGKNPVVTIVTGALSAAFWIFPYQLLQWGPLFPNTLSYSILPLAILALTNLLGLTKKPPIHWFGSLCALLVGLVALLLTQPNGFSAFLAFSIAPLAVFWLRTLRTQHRQQASKPRFALTIVAGVLVAVIYCVIWKLMLLPFNAWQPSRSIPSAAWDVFSGSLLGGSSTLLASTLALAGLLTVFIKRNGWWILFNFFVSGVLYVVAAAIEPGTLRSMLLGSWYQDPYRLAALVPLFTIVLAAMGLNGIIEGVSWLFNRLRKSTKSTERSLLNRDILAFGAAVVAAVIAVPAVLFYNHEGLNAIDKKMAISYSYQPGWVVSADELALMSRLDRIVPKDDLVAVDPFNGGSLAYAISGVKVTQYHLTPAPDAELLSIAKNLSSATAGSETCALADKERIKYILDFGDFYMLNFEAARVYPGFVNVKPSSSVILVDQQGAAKLYKVTSCG